VSAARRAFAKGDLSTAEQICKAVLAEAPDTGGVWTVLTETALARGRLDAAIVSAKRAVALLPRDPIAHILQAKCLFLAGEAGGALAAAEHASKLVGRSADALDALGAIFGLLGLHERALDLCRQAAAARPNVSQYLFNLAATERMMGLLEAAETHADAAISADRRYCLAHYLRADLRVQTVERNHIAEIEALIREAGLPASDEVLLRFALAKELEDIDQHGRAFDEIEAACALQRRSIAYDSRRECDHIDQIIRVQTRDWLASRPIAACPADPIFVVGLPRTGTTLVERILASHSALASAGESGAFAVELHRATQAAPDNPDFSAVGRRYVDAVTAFRVPAERRIVDKTLQNYLYCGMILAALPRAKIILVRRHPLDAGWAMLKAHFQGKFLFSYDQTELADYILAYRRLARHWKATLPPHAFMDVNYEDIVRDQAEQSRRLIAFAGLPWEDGVLRFHDSAAPSATASAVQVRRPIYTSSVGKWRYHADRLEPLCTRLAHEIPAPELTPERADTSRLRATETALSRVCGCKAT
jgi:tetratricopeptide (TPR) repeat protein